MILACAGALALVPALAWPAPVKPPDHTIQIGIVRDAQELSFVPEGPYSISDAEGKVYSLKPGRKYLLAAAEKFLKLGSLILSVDTRLVPQSPESSIRIGDRRRSPTPRGRPAAPKGRARARP